MPVAPAVSFLSASLADAVTGATEEVGATGTRWRTGCSDELQSACIRVQVLVVVSPLEALLMLVRLVATARAPESQTAPETAQEQILSKGPRWCNRSSGESDVVTVAVPVVAWVPVVTPLVVRSTPRGGKSPAPVCGFSPVPVPVEVVTLRSAMRLKARAEDES